MRLQPAFLTGARLTFPPCIHAGTGEDLPIWLTGEWPAIYGIESAASSMGPWLRAMTLTSQFGRTQFLVPGFTNSPQRFYRAVAE